MPANHDFEGILRGASLRVTRPRVAVLTAVRDDPHADTDSIVGVVPADNRRGVAPARVRRVVRFD